MAELKAQIIEMQRSLADTNLRMEEMSNSIFILQEQARANKEALKEVSQPKIYIKEDQDTGMNDGVASSEPMPMPLGGVSMPAYGTEKITAAVGTSPPVSQTSPGGMNQYNSALNSYQKQNYGLAVFDFSSFLKSHPNTNEAELARYYLGLSYFKLNEFSQAIREWEQYLSYYPAGVKAAEVGYRIGVAYNTLGQREKANTYFDLIIRKYEGSEWASKATSAMQ